MVAGALANKPGNGGNAWVALSWALGLRRLGFDVHFVEEIALGACADESGRRVAPEASSNLAYFKSVTGAFGLPATLRCEGGSLAGLTSRELVAVATEAAVIINISGHLRDPRILSLPRRRIFLDLDPGFTQAWYAAGDPGAHLDGHDVFATIGERIGQADCPIPTGGIAWIPTRQPVVLDEWPLPTTVPVRGFTTVSTWRCPFGGVEIGGRMQTLKHHEMRRFIDVARRSDSEFELALAIEPDDSADRRLLVDHGWHLVDPREVAAEPHSFREYVQSSSAEFSVAQGVYTATRSGWLSDRTARYLATGRPAVVQDTNTSLPTGAGLLTFRTVDQAVAATAEVARYPALHAAAARSLAETHLESGAVIGELLHRAEAPR
jgi:hypothetical protein